MKRIVLILGIWVILGAFIGPEILIAAEKIKLTYWAVHRDDKTDAHRQSFVDKLKAANSNVDAEVALIPFEQVLPKQVTAGAAGTLPVGDASVYGVSIGAMMFIFALLYIQFIAKKGELAEVE